MATNNAINQSGEGMVYYDGAGTFTNVPMSDGDLLIGVDSNPPAAVPSFFLEGQNCTFCNLSFTHSAGTLTIAGADGTALSSSNPGLLTMPSNATAGQLVTFLITANQTLTVSDMTGNIGNMTASTAYSNSFPLYIGFMADSSDTNLTGVVTWLPHITTAPATSTNIGDPSAANADQQYSAFAFDDITEANYTESNIGLIGSLTATKNASDVYTLDSLTVKDGVGKYNDNTYFTFATGLFGAGTSTYLKDNGGTAPTFSTNEVIYILNTEGYVTIHHYMSGDGGTDGSAGVNSYAALPYEFYQSISDNISFGAGLVDTTAWGVEGVSCMQPESTTNNIGVYRNTSANLIDNDDFGNGNRNWRTYINYLANWSE